ncbi:hypothetical protein GQ53DRAFT_778721 [Thozetella sp. PMI_491]|nr:hypothetical protein GQ53DRAFT_778721 [Thozetella sp. PMI_491]
MSNPNAELYRNEEHIEDGYPSVARSFAKDPDNETFVFRKFDVLSAQNLLYLQCEILDLEQQVRSNELSLRRDHSTRGLLRWWENLAKEASEEHGMKQAKDRIALIRRLRKALKEYHEALVLQSQIFQLARPEKRVVDVCRYWMLHHDESGTWGKLDDDATNQFLNNPQDLREMAPGGSTGVGMFEESKIVAIVNIITILIAAIFLIGAMVGFKFVQNETATLVMVAAFTVAFAVSIGFITAAKRVEIFAATAA